MPKYHALNALVDLHSLDPVLFLPESTQVPST